MKVGATIKQLCHFPYQSVGFVHRVDHVTVAFDVLALVSGCNNSDAYPLLQQPCMIFALIFLRFVLLPWLKKQDSYTAICSVLVELIRIGEICYNVSLCNSALVCLHGRDWKGDEDRITICPSTRMVSGKSIRVVSFLLFGTVGYAQNDNCTGIIDSIGDGYCDQVNNNELCGYDQGIN